MKNFLKKIFSEIILEKYDRFFHFEKNEKNV